MVKKSKNVNVVADISLYGNREIGFGWLAGTDGGQLYGTGEPVAGQSCTDCVFQAAARLAGDRRFARNHKAIVRIFEPRGQMMAEMKLHSPTYFGNLKWQVAPVYEIQLADILAASE